MASPQPIEETPSAAEAALEETLLERELKVSIELVQQGKLGNSGTECSPSKPERVLEHANLVSGC